MSLADLSHVWVEAPFFSDALSLLPDHVIVLYPADPPDVPYANALPAQAILAAPGVRYNEELFLQLPNLRMVTRTGIGVDNINLEDATRHGVVICNTPDGPTE